MLSIDPRDAVPIWNQIAAEVRRLVASGVLQPGGAVPSVRDMAQQLRVNPATVAKAYQSLVDEGLLTVRRGEGTFVAERPATVTRSERRQVLSTAALRYASLAVTIGAPSEEAIDRVESAFEQLTRGRRRE